MLPDLWTVRLSLGTKIGISHKQSNPYLCKYAYYYCNGDHTHVKAKAEEANESFAKYVEQLKPNSAILALYNEILLDILGEKVKEHRNEADKLQIELDRLKERINRVNDLFFDGEITKAG